MVTTYRQQQPTWDEEYRQEKQQSRSRRDVPNLGMSRCDETLLSVCVGSQKQSFTERQDRFMLNQSLVIYLLPVLKL